jgi:Arc/MetJ-type ribon-helix-helix transcriptional regulator
MTIHLPNELERSIEAMVQNGRFVSIDDAMAEAARLLLRQVRLSPSDANARGDVDPLLGSMPEAADEPDAIVADAMKRRREEPWRVISVE